MLTVGIGIGPSFPQLRAKRGRYVLNVKEHGLRGDGQDENPERIEALIATALSMRGDPDGHGVTLYWPEGIYRIPRPIVVDRTDFEFYKLRFLGDGKDQTHIRAKFNADDVFRFTNTGGSYSAQLSFHGLHFYGGNTVISIDNCFYSEIVDCVFRRTGEGGGYSVKLTGNANGVRMLNCWAFHAEDIIYSDGAVDIGNCTFGEDAGGINVKYLRAVNCAWWASAYSRANTPQGEEPAAIRMQAGTAHIVGCTIGVNPGNAFLDVHYPETVTLADNRYTLAGNSPIVRSRFLGHDRPAAQPRGVTIDGGTAHILGDTALWEVSAGNRICNSTVQGLRIFNPASRTVTVPDDFFDPDMRNIYRYNPVTEG